MEAQKVSLFFYLHHQRKQFSFYPQPLLCKYKEICSIKADQKGFADIIKSILENYCMSNYTRCARFKVFRAKGNSEEAQKILPKEIEKANELILALSKKEEEESLDPNKKEVLIVDSKPELLTLWDELCSRLPNKQEITTTKANNGQIGIQKMLSKKYNVVITEIDLPLLSGDKMIKKMRESSQNLSTPIIVISKSLNPEMIKSLKSFGVSKILAKPSSPETLHSSLNEIINDFQKELQVMLVLIGF